MKSGILALRVHCGGYPLGSCFGHVAFGRIGRVRGLGGLGGRRHDYCFSFAQEVYGNVI